MWKPLRRRWGRVRGELEAVRYRTVSGWAYDSRYPRHTSVLRIQVNGADVGIAVANRPRRDLQVAGLASPRRGFEWCLPDDLGVVESVRVLTDQGDALPSAASPICPHTNRPLPAEWRAGERLRFPSFFILGAAKCGTSAVHAYLGRHPDICVSDPKEPFFFEAEYERGPAYYFNRYFAHWAGESIVGESRHRNLYMPYTAERIFHFNSAAKLLVFVRNPVERAVSHWASRYFADKEPLALRSALEQDLERIQAGISFEDPRTQETYERTFNIEGRAFLRTYVDSGYYMEQIERFLKLFPREQMRIVLQEDLASDPQGNMAELFAFVGADAARVPAGGYARVNESNPGMREHLDDDTAARLVKHYRPHNDRLAKFLGRSLDHWDRPFGTTS